MTPHQKRLRKRLAARAEKRRGASPSLATTLTDLILSATHVVTRGTIWTAKVVAKNGIPAR